MPAPGAVPDIRAAAHVVLDTYVSELKATGLVLPQRQGITPGGQLAFDGEQFTVTFIGLTRGQPAYPQTIAAQPTQVLWFYEFELVILRKMTVPTGRGTHGGIPSSAELAADFDDLTAPDAMALIEASQAIHAGYLIVPPNVPFAYGPLNSIGPEGTLAGSRLNLNFQAGMSAAGTY